MNRKKLSGWQNKLNRAKAEAQQAKEYGSLNKYITVFAKPIECDISSDNAHSGEQNSQQVSAEAYEIEDSIATESVTRPIEVQELQLEHLLKRENFLSVCSTTLFVEHLSALVSLQEISSTFKTFGDIISVEFLTHRRCAFVVMKTRHDAYKALNHLQNFKLQEEAITLAWAPGKGIMSQEWKKYFEADIGVAFIPWAQLASETNINDFSNGGYVDEESVPSFLKCDTNQNQIADAPQPLSVDQNEKRRQTCIGQCKEHPLQAKSSACLGPLDENLFKNATSSPELLLVSSQNISNVNCTDSNICIEPLQLENHVPCCSGCTHLSCPNSMHVDNDSFCDPGKWPQIVLDLQKVAIVTCGPKRVLHHNFPSNDCNRRFTTKNYFTELSNKQRIDRRWLVYSKSKDAIFCFCCKLFGSKKIQLTENGYSFWKNMSVDLKTHETSRDHLINMKLWIDLELQLKKGTTVDAAHRKVINAETQRWQNVLTRLFEITKFLARRSIAFRGSNERLYENNNGNFLGLVELIAQFDSVLEDHVKRATTHKISDTYLGKHIQNEMINLIGESVRQIIVRQCKEAKYYSIMLDCTRDLSKKEQMTVVIRFVNVTANVVSIEERFLGYVEALSSTGEMLTDIFLKYLHDLGLSIIDCRGQSYDNGSNMRGINKGVQKRILDKNPRAFFVPCVAHNLNLVLGDTANATITGTKFFGFLGRLYSFFSCSPQRWAIFKAHVKNCTLKPLSGTRWEARVESVKPLRFQMFEVVTALTELSNSATDSETRFDAVTLIEYMSTFEYVVSIVVWYDILFAINVASKKVQSISIELHSTIVELNKTQEYLENYRNDGFEKAIAVAQGISNEMGLKIEFDIPGQQRKRKRTRQFDYEAPDETIVDPKKKFEVEFFNAVVDVAINSLVERCDVLHGHSELFGFLYDIQSLQYMSDNELRKNCMDLQNALSYLEESDVSALSLFEELQLIKTYLEHQVSPKEALTYIIENNYAEIFPNTVIALKIILTMAITVASGERSFSKLRLVKSYTRTTMTDARLSNLAITSIESDLAATLNHEKLISDFSKLKARKVPL